MRGAQGNPRRALAQGARPSPRAMTFRRNVAVFLLAMLMAAVFLNNQMNANAVALQSAARAGSGVVDDPGTAVEEVVQCDSTEGGFYVKARLDWAPHGARRYLDLVDIGWFTNLTMLRVPELGRNPIAQFGGWSSKPLAKYVDAHKEEFGAIPDDPDTAAMARGGQTRGHWSYGGSGANSRSYHMWVARAAFAGVSPNLGKADWEISVAETLPRGRVVEVLEGAPANVRTAARDEMFGTRLADRMADRASFRDVGDAFADTIPVVGDMKPWGDGPDFGAIAKDPTFSDPATYPGEYLAKNFGRVGAIRWCRRVRARVRTTL